MSDPKRFGKFEIRGVLGRGGVGVIYLAIDPREGKEVAIKEVQADPEASAADVAELDRRFRSELPELGRLVHPNIVRVHDVGEGGESRLIAMELVEGRTLDSHLRTIGRPSYPEIITLGRQIAAALDHAHQQGVVHHDVRPGNVLVTPGGVVKVTDFAVARVVSADAARAGARLGTRLYMSPEQVRGKPAGPRSDQYSLAVMLYEMLTGGLPFAADPPAGLLHRIANETADPPRSRERSLPQGIDELFARALAKDPEDRLQSCGELVAELQVLLLGSRPELDSFRARIDTPEVPAAVVPPPAKPSAWSTPDQPGQRAPETFAERMRALYADHRRGFHLAILGLVVFVAGSIMLLVGGRSGEEEAALASAPAAKGLADPAAASPDPAIETHSIRIEAGETAARIWIDGIDTGLSTPTEVELRGRRGEERDVELRREGEVVAARSFLLGPETPRQWVLESHELGEPRVFYVTSRPDGASLILDGADSELTTPASIELVPDRRYALRLSLAGHEPVTWNFSLADLREEQLESGRLHFPLRSTEPPAAVTVSAGYPVIVFVDGDQRAPATRHQLSLAAGRHTLRLVAEEVFLRQTYTLELGSGEQTDLQAPEAVRVDLVTEPPGALVTIDGLEIGTTPISNRAIVLGAHDFQFFWPQSETSQERQESITRDGQRIFATTD